LAQKLYKKANNNGWDLCITSFNGGYVGYIVPHHYYQLQHAEARQMNWVGPHTGEMLTWIIGECMLRKEF
jgi:hypothetical protein